jgi:DNA-damage-inducible protein J
MGFMKTATLNIRLDPDLKHQAEEVFSLFGLTLSQAVNVFLSKAVLDGGMPFELRQPRYNAETEEAMAEAREIASRRAEAKRRASGS